MSVATEKVCAGKVREAKTPPQNERKPLGQDTQHGGRGREDWFRTHGRPREILINQGVSRVFPSARAGASIAASPSPRVRDRARHPLRAVGPPARAGGLGRGAGKDLSPLAKLPLTFSARLGQQRQLQGGSGRRRPTLHGLLAPCTHTGARTHTARLELRGRKPGVWERERGRISREGETWKKRGLVGRKKKGRVCEGCALQRVT